MSLIVVKIGGSLLEGFAPALIERIARLKKEGARILVVHGGGRYINALAERLNVQSVFVDGLRRTNAEMLEIVEMVSAGTLNKNLSSLCARSGVRAVGISGRDGNLLKTRAVPNLGLTGEVVSVNPAILKSLLDSDITPLIASMGEDETGQAHNLNADVTAAALAAALGADRLVLFTDVAGVLDEDKRTIRRIALSEIEPLIARGIIVSGMIPKVRAVKRAMQEGVKSAIIAQGDESGLNAFKTAPINATLIEDI